MNEKIEKALNDHMNAEFYSSYLYLSMCAYFESISLTGFANWMRIQAQEELFHAMKFYNFINERGGKVRLGAVEQPKIDWSSSVEVFEDVVNHEKYVTSLINDLVNLAVDEKDHATKIFLQWFVTEQIEEEANTSDVLHKLKLTGGEGSGLFMLDRELSQRVFVQPADA